MPGPQEIGRVDQQALNSTGRRRHAPCTAGRLVKAAAANRKPNRKHCAVKPILPSVFVGAPWNLAARTFAPVLPHNPHML
jgi:hypothetical protein